MVALPSNLGGLTPFHLASAASTNATLIRVGPAKLYAWAIKNTNAAIRYIAFHDTTEATTAGQRIYFKWGVSASAAANTTFHPGIQFTSGLAITLVVNSADNDATAVAANDLIVNLFYN